MGYDVISDLNGIGKQRYTGEIQANNVGWDFVSTLLLSQMFAEAYIDDFHAIVRKRTASMMDRLRRSSNSILRTLNDKFDRPFFRHCVRRPLTTEEVLTARQEITWRRTKFCLACMFWALLAMFLSIITCIVLTSPQCNTFDKVLQQVPSVPPVHMGFAPLISRLNDPMTSNMDSDKVYTL